MHALTGACPPQDQLWGHLRWLWTVLRLQNAGYLSLHSPRYQIQNQTPVYNMTCILAQMSRHFQRVFFTKVANYNPGVILFPSVVVNYIQVSVTIFWQEKFIKNSPLIRKCCVSPILPCPSPASTTQTLNKEVTPHSQMLHFTREFHFKTEQSLKESLLNKMKKIFQTLTRIVKA